MYHFNSRTILVLMESLAASGHVFATTRARLAEKLELYRFDPLGLLTCYVYI